jgi:single-strand DNA-binding protein
MNYNKVIIIGRLVREPEISNLPSGTQVANFVIAYNRSFKDQSGQWKEESHFFDVKVFGRLIQQIVQRLRRGDLVLVEGRLHQDKWLDKNTGEPRSKIRIVALDIKLLSPTRGVKSENPPSMEDVELPPLEEDILPPAKGGEEKDELDLEKFLFGEEEPKKPQKGNKDENLDDFDDLVL